MSTTQDTTQCRALTADGERCSRPAGEDGYCFQHGPDDETAQDAAAVDGGEANAEAEEESDDEPAQETEEENAEADEQDAETEEEQPADEDDEGGGRSDGSGDGSLNGVMEVRALAEDVTSDVVGAPLDRIIEVERREEDGGWLVVVEAVERRAIPDTEDLLGRYAIQFDGNGTVEGYRLRNRYRRAHDLDDEYE